LAAFQVTILKHALRFPNLERLVYSTCSVYKEENEDVVAAVLPYASDLGFTLETALPQWPRRGLLGSYDWADKVVRVHPELDATDGFFVAFFVRKTELERDRMPSVEHNTSVKGVVKNRGKRRKSKSLQPKDELTKNGVP
jgi:putative methyltransferase